MTAPEVDKGFHAVVCVVPCTKKGSGWAQVTPWLRAVSACLKEGCLFQVTLMHPKCLIQAIAAAKSLQPCLTLCNPIDSSRPGSPIPGILQARILEWIAISFSNAWKWKVKGSRSIVSDPQRPHGLQPTRLLRPWDFPGKSTGVGCHCLLSYPSWVN